MATDWNDDPNQLLTILPNIPPHINKLYLGKFLGIEDYDSIKDTLQLHFTTTPKHIIYVSDLLDHPIHSILTVLLWLEQELIKNRNSFPPIIVSVSTDEDFNNSIKSLNIRLNKLAKDRNMS